jgi:hypothetical protein
MRKAKSIAVMLAVLAILSLASYWFLTWNLQRSLEKADWQGLDDIIKAAIGEAVTKAAVTEETPGTSTLRNTKEARGGNTKPDEIKSAARRADTYVAALKVGNVAISLRSQGASLPATSSGLSAVEPRLRLDAWGHPFCLVEADGRVAVISSGSSAMMSSKCQEVEISRQDLVRLPSDKLYQYPSGALVLLAARR